MEYRIHIATTLASAALFCIGGSAKAQVSNYDTAYPMGAPYTIMQRGGILPEERNTQVRGRLYYDGQYREVPQLKHHRHRNDDTIYGRTIEINVGNGGAHMY